MAEESELYLKIKKLADKQKISMLTLNDRAKLGTNAIYRWRNQTPGTDKIKKVADVLGVSVDYLLGNDDNSNNDDDMEEFYRIDLSGVPESERASIKSAIDKYTRFLLDDMED